MTDYYIATTGNDSTGDGSSGNPWATPDYALTGNRLDQGDTLKCYAGTYSSFTGANTYIHPAFGGSSGDPVIIEPVSGVVTFDTPSNASTGNAFFFLNQGAWTKLTFKNILFTNSNNINTRFIWAYGHTVRIEDGEIDTGSAASGRPVFQYGDDSSITCIELIRMKLKTQSGAAIVNSARTDGATYTSEFTAGASSFNRVGSGTNGVVLTTAPLKVEWINCTTYTDLNAPIIRFSNTTVGASKLKLTNCLFYNGFATAVFTIRFDNQTIIDYFHDNRADTAIWDVSNNVWYSNYTNGSDIPYFYSLGAFDELFQLPFSTYFIDPEFTSIVGEDFTIQSSSMIQGFGSNSDLPATDLNGEAWTGNDIGCYKTPLSNKQVVLQNKAAFAGNSIMNGTITNGGFAGLSGKTVVAIDIFSYSGYTMQNVHSLVDIGMATDPANIVYLSVGANNISTGSPSPNMTNDELSEYINSIMLKIKSYGAEAIYLGLTSAIGDPPDNSDVDAINAGVEAYGDLNNYKYTSILDEMELAEPVNWETVYYDNLPADVHPNNTGYEFIAALANDVLSINRIIKNPMRPVLRSILRPCLSQ